MIRRLRCLLQFGLLGTFVLYIVHAYFFAALNLKLISLSYVLAYIPLELHSMFQSGLAWAQIYCTGMATLFAGLWMLSRRGIQKVRWRKV